MEYHSQYQQNSFDSDTTSSHLGLLSEKSSIVGIHQPKRWITPRIISDFTIGLSDGLTVPFALTAGLSTLGSGKIVVSAGLAELVAGAISMGVAGYLGAKGELDAQIDSSRGSKRLVTTEPEETLAMIKAKFQELYLPDEILDSIVEYYANAPSQRSLLTLMRFEESECETQLLTPWLTGVTIAVGYFFGGSVPLLPYVFTTVQQAFAISVFITATVLFTFGCIKVPLAGSSRDIRTCVKSGIEMLVLGGLAAGAALICVQLLDYFRGT